MSAKQLETRVKSLKERIDKKREELSTLTTQHKQLREQLAEAKKTEKASGKTGGAAKKSSGGKSSAKKDTTAAASSSSGSASSS